MSRKEEVNIRKLRYVLYARKSTEDDNRQVRSIDDQIRDCQKLAKELGITVVGDPIRETKSAKKPGKRPLFSMLLKDVESGKYDGILCWHPDRLCRNMLEGGQIINMLDEGVLKDIRFHSHQFSNDANGKMLLGMLFVFSKQYSDDLSDKVSRGVQGNLDEGKSSGAPKWGYSRSEVTGHYEPNEYFDAIKEAWEMRSRGESLQTITKFLSEKGVHRITKNTKRPAKFRVSIQTLSNIFRDSVYYGKLNQANQSVDLRTIYDFKPMVDEKTFNQIQAMSYGRTQDKHAKKRVSFYPLRRMVFCAVCGSTKPMSVGKNLVGSKTHHVLTYTCKNPDCIRKPRSLRAKHVFNSIYGLLDSFEFGDKTYELYSKEMDEMTDEKITEIREKILSKRGALTHIMKELNDRALSLGRMKPDSEVYRVNENKVNELAIKRVDIEQEIELLEKKIANPSKIKLSKDQFLNQLKMLPDKMRAGSAVEKDLLCRNLFLNLHVDNEKVVNYIWREPYASLVKTFEFKSGGGGWNRTNYQAVMSRLL